MKIRTSFSKSQSGFCPRSNPRIPRPVRSVMEAPVEPLKMVIIFEGLAGLFRANELWDRLAARFKGQIEIKTCSWHFALLRDAKLRSHAVRQAAGADIIVICARAAYDLPDYIKYWIKTWLPEGNASRHVALVAIPVDEAPVSGARAILHERLHEMAEKSRLDFFWNSENWKPNKSSAADKRGMAPGCKANQFSSSINLHGIDVISEERQRRIEF